MSDLIDVLHWLRPSNWACVEFGKAAQTLVVITELRAENERLREALEEIAAAVRFIPGNDEKRIANLQAENERLRAIIDTLTAKAPATASLAVFACSKCRESVDTVYEVGSGANVKQVCVKCVQN